MATVTPTRNLFGTDGVRGVGQRAPHDPRAGAAPGPRGHLRGRPRQGPCAAHRDRQGHAPLGLHDRDGASPPASAPWAAACCCAARSPRPAVAHLTLSMRADAGVVISASHNPYADNGIKIFGADGFKLPDEAEAEIERLMDGRPRLLGARKTGPRSAAPSGCEARAAATSSSPRPPSRATSRSTGVRIVVDARPRRGLQGGARSCSRSWAPRHRHRRASPTA